MNQDDPLSKILHTWEVDPAPDPHFRSNVWARIGAARAETWAGYLRAHLNVWALVALVALGSGGWIGHRTAQARVEADRSVLVASYVQSIDARSMTGADTVLP